MRALIVEDDSSMAVLLRRLLEEERFDVHTASTGEEGHILAATGSYDAIILDLQLPDMNGVTVIQRLRRARKDDPILVLTADDDEESTITSLDAGADDFLRKPFRRDELRARVRALARRGGARRTELLVCRNVVLNRLTRKVLVGGRELHLMPKEMGVLEHLLISQGEVVSRSALLEKVWDLAFDPGTNVVDVNVTRLRRKLAESGGAVRVTTRRGLGYVLEPVA